MTDFRLRSFLEVVRTGGFSTAANVLHLTQPAVSQHIASLEEAYQVPLLTRSGRKALPTAAGSLLYDYAQKVEALYRSIDRDMANLHLSERHYEVGATLTVAEYLMPELIGAFRRQAERVKIRLSVQNTASTIELLKRNHLVLGVVEGPVVGDEILARKLVDDELIVVCAPDHRLADRAGGDGVSLETLLSYDIILREPGSGTREVFERYLLSLGFDLHNLRPVMEIGSNNAVKSLVRSGLGVSVISQLAVSEELRDGSLVRIPLAHPRILRELTFIWTEYSDVAFVDEFQGFCQRHLSQ